MLALSPLRSRNELTFLCVDRGWQMWTRWVLLKQRLPEIPRSAIHPLPEDRARSQPPSYQALPHAFPYNSPCSGPLWLDEEKYCELESFSFLQGTPIRMNLSKK